MAELSPMMRQFVDIKNQNKDKILFFRVGDFYEMFFDDAILASKELELTLTGKECGLEERAPMCGVPYHSAEAYIARLIGKGYKVAICEQVQGSDVAKGLMERDVVRVVTPGTVIENSMLKDDRNNFIVSIFIQPDEAGVCFADVSTGTAYTSSLKAEGMDKAIIAELSRFAPSEILFNSAILKYTAITAFIKEQLTCTVELLDDEAFSAQASEKVLAKQFDGLQTATGVPVSGSSAHGALGALLAYLQNTQKKGVERLKTVIPYSEAEYMRLPLSTRSNLEITETLRGREKKGTLLWVLDKAGTAMGKRLLRLWLEQPLMDSAKINSRLDGVQELYSANVTRLEIMEILRKVFDMERLLTRMVYGSAMPREVQMLALTCLELPSLKLLISAFTSGEMQEVQTGIDTLDDVRILIEETLSDELPTTLKDGGFIRAGFSAEVDELRDIMHGGKGVLAEIEARLKEETGIRTLRIGYNRVFGYYIEVSKTFVHQVPEHFVRKQTLTSGERYITDELKQLESKILGAGERLTVLERQLFEDLLQTLSQHSPRIQSTAQSIARLDVLTSLAHVAVTNDYCRPEVDASEQVHIVQGRHPVIEQAQQGQLFVPNDTLLDTNENRMQIITGPNMAGKSTYMRQTALIVLMAQVGSFVPAKQCHVGVCDAIFTRVGAWDDLAQGKSTFMVEMTEVAEILRDAKPKSLVVLDEIGRGTSTFDGMSIAQAVVEHIASLEMGVACKTLFATHYHELTDLENAIDGVKNYNIAVKKRGDDITFLRRIVRGPADDSYGIQVGKLAGLPDSVVNRAKQVLKALESHAGKTNQVMQLDFETYENLSSPAMPAEIMEKLNQVDPETLTPLEALKLVYELKSSLPPS